MRLEDEVYCCGEDSSNLLHFLFVAKDCESLSCVGIPYNRVCSTEEGGLPVGWRCTGSRDCNSGRCDFVAVQGDTYIRKYCAPQLEEGEQCNENSGKWRSVKWYHHEQTELKNLFHDCAIRLRVQVSWSFGKQTVHGSRKQAKGQHSLLGKWPMY